MGGDKVKFESDDINFLVALARRYEKLTSKSKKGGRMPNQGKPLPEKQLQSFAKKEPSAPRSERYDESCETDI